MGGICERDGECLKDLGCVKEYYGFDCSQKCTLTCNDDTCDREDGICDECRKVPNEQSPLCREAGGLLLDQSISASLITSIIFRLLVENSFSDLHARITGSNWSEYCFEHLVSAQCLAITLNIFTAFI